MYANGNEDAAGRVGYRRSAGSPRGEARRRELLERVTDDLATNGLVDFSLRRAARAASTTHKVLLYHFEGADDLLRQAVLRLRDRRIDNALLALRASAGDSLVARVRSVWSILVDQAESRVLDQAIGLAMYDPERYAHLARDASAQYLGALLAMCPEPWSASRKREVAELILATMRGFLAEWRTTRDAERIEAGMTGLIRALEREEAE